jgi:arabinogalactan endo-1,4-beta-galactosidase
MKQGPLVAAVLALLAVEGVSSCVWKADVQLGEAPSSDVGGQGGAATGQPNLPRFLLGADISTTQEETLPFVDTDGQTKNIFELLQGHGVNAIRLRTFVDPTAPFGYASTNNSCPGRPEAFGDQARVLAYAKQAKSHGMAVFLDFHYSDTWADGNSQIVPASWREASSVEALAQELKSYTSAFLQAAIENNARPDIVQIGNGITGGLLLHVPTAETNCFGDNVVGAPVRGAIAQVSNLGTLLRAATAAIREVDPSILIALHAGNAVDSDAVTTWIDEVRSEQVDFDVFGMSCFSALQGPPSAWQNTYSILAETYPDLKFIVAEYKDDLAETNEVIASLPKSAGLGTFYWEPTLSGDFGSALFVRESDMLRGDVALDEFDSARDALGLE